MLTHYRYISDIVNRIVYADNVAIYGARIVGKEVLNCLRGKPYCIDVSCFIVSDHVGNPVEIMGKPVFSISEAQNIIPKSTLIIISVLERYYKDITTVLDKYGYTNTLKMTFESDLWQFIRGNYIENHFRTIGINYVAMEDVLMNMKFQKGDGKDVFRNVSIYRVVSNFDKELRENIEAYDWEVPIQVGAEYNDSSIADIKDNSGDNISLKNRMYCELTALYWIWRNDVSSDMIGICHYRRHFKLDEEKLNLLGKSDLDVILTIPILNFPDVGHMYANDHCGSDWNVMLEGLRKLQPEYYETAITLQEGVFYFAYNMFIARKEIFNNYCEWLFPILYYCENKIGVKDDPYQGRYIGFLAERLLSIYMLTHWNQYKIAIAEKHFME